MSNIEQDENFQLCKLFIESLNITTIKKKEFINIIKQLLNIQSQWGYNKWTIRVKDKYDIRRHSILSEEEYKKFTRLLFNLLVTQKDINDAEYIWSTILKEHAIKAPIQMGNYHIVALDTHNYSPIGMWIVADKLSTTPPNRIYGNDSNNNIIDYSTILFQKKDPNGVTVMRNSHIVAPPFPQCIWNFLFPK